VAAAAGRRLASAAVVAEQQRVQVDPAPAQRNQLDRLGRRSVSMT
jgi:hypothetical protein